MPEPGQRSLDPRALGGEKFACPSGSIGATLPHGRRSVVGFERADVSELRPENPEGARFCNECASPLQDSDRQVGEERKIVSVLFVDLVGFTARAETLDPEDVRALLAPFHARIRH